VTVVGSGAMERDVDGAGLCVAIDVGPLVGGRPTGIGLFTSRLLEGLERVQPAPRVIRYVLSARATLPAGVRRLPYPARAAHLAWGRFDHPRGERTLRGADVVHGTNYVAPPTRRPTVISVHDCTMITHRELVHPVVRAFEPIVRRAVARGAWVAVPSGHVEQQVRELFGANKVRRIAYGSPAPPTTGGAGAHRPVAIATIGSRPFALAIGTREPRKNLPRLVAAYGLAHDSFPELALVVVGAPGPDDPAIERALDALRPPARAGIVVLPYVSDVDRMSLLRTALLLAYPSLDEGFGFPALEAMMIDLPVLAAAAGSLPEVCGDAAVLIDPLDTASIATGLVRLATDPVLRQELQAAGRVQAARFSWADTAAGFATLYRDALMEHRSA
jgi:glycosyltransferase involved in cell wall biosynthesis